jgi:hypothetical protein
MAIALRNVRFCPKADIESVRYRRQNVSVPTPHNCRSLDAVPLAQKLRKVLVHSQSKERVAASHPQYIVE